MLHISFWFMLMMLIYQVEAYLLWRKTQQLYQSTVKESGLEVHTEKTEYMIMSGEQNGGQNHNINTGYKSLQRVEEFKYLGTILLNQNCMHE